MMEEKMLNHELLEACDNEFGDSPSYWVTLMRIALDADNQKVAEEIIDRCMCSVARRSKRKRPR